MTWLSEVDFHPEEQLVVQQGDKGSPVENIQRLLVEQGYGLSVDGDFGPGTVRVVKEFQTDQGLVVDGRVGSKTLLLLMSLPPDPRVLSQADLEAAAVELNVPVAAVMAVNQVESRGSGFFNNDLPAILYERHVMRRQLKAHNINPTPFMTSQPDLVNNVTGGYKGGVAEYSRLTRAKDIHSPSAQESCSWGAFQIMGYHWKHLGYASVDDYVERMCRSEGEHLNAFVRFIKADATLHRALANLDWAGFARQYNGPSYAKNHYDVKMAEAYAQHASE